jgi:hypothetical protein
LNVTVLNKVSHFDIVEVPVKLNTPVVEFHEEVTPVGRVPV